MKSKAEIKQIAMRNAMRIWEVRSAEELDPIVKLLIEVFCDQAYEIENNIEDIRERLLEQIAATLTPDTMVNAKPAHSVMKATPIEPETDITRKDIFYSEQLTNQAKRYDLGHIHFAPVTDLRLIKGDINFLLCERSLYKIGKYGAKEYQTKAKSFYQDLNNCVWVGLDIDPKVESLKDIHFYIDFANTSHKYELYDLLSYTTWSISGHSLSMGIGMPQNNEMKDISGGIFGYYDLLQTNDDEVMDLYRKQFLHIQNDIQIKEIEKAAFPDELIPYFPARVKELESQYWIKVNFPAHFKYGDIEDINISMNSFPISNKNIKTKIAYNNQLSDGIVPLSVKPGEFFLAVEKVVDFSNNEYNFIPYFTGGSILGGTYKIKRGGVERFGKRDLKDLFEKFTSLLRTDLVTFTALNMDNTGDFVAEIEQLVNQLKERVNFNNAQISELLTYLLIEPKSEKADNIEVNYWLTNCELVNNLPAGTLVKPLKTIPVETNSSILLKSTTGGKSILNREEKMIAYKYALSSRDQIFSAADIENFCQLKFYRKLQKIKVRRGVACSIKPLEGLIRTVDVLLTPIADEIKLFDPATLGILKIELEKRSPDTYNYRIILDKPIN